MKDSIVVELPYPSKFLWFTFAARRKVGFLFTNLSIFLFRENQGIETSEDYQKWVKEKGEARGISEMFFAAAQAYCMVTKTKENFTKSQLLQAIALSDEQTQNLIVNKWKQSQTFGAVEAKKKVKPK